MSALTRLLLLGISLVLGLAQLVAAQTVYDIDTLTDDAEYIKPKKRVY